MLFRQVSCLSSNTGIRSLDHRTTIRTGTIDLVVCEVCDFVICFLSDQMHPDSSLNRTSFHFRGSELHESFRKLNNWTLVFELVSHVLASLERSISLPRLETRKRSRHHNLAGNRDVSLAQLSSVPEFLRRKLPFWSLSAFAFTVADNDQNHRVAASDLDFNFGPTGNSGAFFCYLRFSRFGIYVASMNRVASPDSAMDLIS